MLDVVAADAPDAADREFLVAAFDRDGGLRRRRNDVGVSAHGAFLSQWVWIGDEWNGGIASPAAGMAASHSIWPGGVKATELVMPRLPVICALALLLSGCYTTRDRYVGGGALIGGTTGALIGGAFRGYRRRRRGRRHRRSCRRPDRCGYRAAGRMLCAHAARPDRPVPC